MGKVNNKTYSSKTIMIHSNIFIHINRLQNNSSLSSHKYKNTILTMTYDAEGNTRRLHVLQSAACVSDGACAYMKQPTGVSECQQMLFLYPQLGPQPKQPEAEKRRERKERRRQTEEERACALVHAASCRSTTVTINLCLRR